MHQMVAQGADVGLDIRCLGIREEQLLLIELLRHLHLEGVLKRDIQRHERRDYYGKNADDEDITLHLLY
jgi:hypothetical protein